MTSSLLIMIKGQVGGVITHFSNNNWLCPLILKLLILRRSFCYIARSSKWYTKEIASR